MKSHVGGQKKTRIKMKRFFVSAGLAASVAGMTSIHAQSMQAGTSPKLWNVSANLRGFYDDNYSVSSAQKGSFGFEFSPSISANVAFGQTDIGVKYTFGLFYYLQRADNGLNPLDLTHTGDLWLDHAFNERWKLNVTDSLADGQDPQLVQGGAVVRVNGNNLGNRANIKLTTDWTKEFSTAVRYGNNLYIYSNNSNTNAANPSEAALLNRIEQNAGIDLQWHFAPETIGYVGYNYSWVRYDGNAQIAAPVTIIFPTPRIVQYFSSARDYNAHYGYLGLSHQITPNLTANARGGASIVDLYNDPVSPSTSVAPYADLSLTYTYRPGSYVQAGYTHNINSTDIATPSAATHQLTAYQESSTFYLDINHRFNSKLSATLLGQYEYSTYKDGAYGGNGDDQINASIDLNYQLNRHLAAQAGYNFSDLLSSIQGRGNARNRVYLGLSANY
jgi:hypothetical protein